MYQRDEHIVLALRIVHNLKVNQDFDMFSKILDLKRFQTGKLESTGNYEWLNNFSDLNEIKCIPSDSILKIIQIIRLNAQGDCKF